MKTVLVTGASGLVGSALQKIADPTKFNFIFCDRKRANLKDHREVDILFKESQPEYVIHTAAKVGGVAGNATHQAEYFYDNILINSHVIHYAHKYHVQKLIAFSSVCIFPDGIPIVEEKLLHQGDPHHTNFAYAYAKRMIDIQIKAYKSQYKIKNFCSLIPVNIFGENDFYNLDNAHVIPSLIHKIHLAKENHTDLIVWGDGSAKREFIYSQDVARIALELLMLEELPDNLLIAGSREYSIKEIVDRLCNIAHFEGNIIWDKSKPSGSKMRPCDITLFKNLFKNFQLTPFENALEKAYVWFETNWPNIRV